MKKILERDDTASRTMVLCVSSVTVTKNQVDDTDEKQADNDGEKDGQGTANKMEVTTCDLIRCFEHLNSVNRGKSEIGYRKEWFRDTLKNCTNDDVTVVKK